MFQHSNVELLALEVFVQIGENATIFGYKN